MCKVDDSQDCIPVGNITHQNKPGSYSMQLEGEVDSVCNVRLDARNEVEQITCMVFDDDNMAPLFWQYRLKDLDKQQKNTFMFPQRVIAPHFTNIRKIDNEDTDHKEQQSTYMSRKAPIAGTRAVAGMSPKLL